LPAIPRPDRPALDVTVTVRPQNQVSKELPETDAIFDYLRQVHTEAAQNRQTLRISLDTKAKVKIGEFSHGGVTRGQRSAGALAAARCSVPFVATPRPSILDACRTDGLPDQGDCTISHCPNRICSR
jgi:hypothetical protein